MQCYQCKGKMVKGKAPYTINRHGYHLVIDDVPAWVCQQCGEIYFEGNEVDAVQSIIKAIDSNIPKVRSA